MNDNAENFGANLRRIREEKKISRQELEEKTGISSVTLAGYENTHRTPNLKNLVTIANALEVMTDELLGRNDFFKRELEKKNLDSRFERAKTMMTLLGLSTTEQPYQNFDNVDIRIDDVFDSYNSTNYKHFMYKNEFVELVETMERKAIRENKPFSDVFFEGAKIKK